MLDCVSVVDAVASCSFAAVSSTTAQWDRRRRRHNLTVDNSRSRSRRVSTAHAPSSSARTCCMRWTTWHTTWRSIRQSAATSGSIRRRTSPSYGVLRRQRGRGSDSARRRWLQTDIGSARELRRRLQTDTGCTRNSTRSMLNPNTGISLSDAYIICDASIQHDLLTLDCVPVHCSACG